MWSRCSPTRSGFVQFWGVVPIGMLVGLGVSFLIGCFLLLGKRTPTIIFVALGTLTASYAAERLVAGWQWVGAGNGMSIWEFLRIGSYEIEPGLVFYYIAVAFLVVIYLVSRYVVRSQFGLVLAGMRQNEERLAFFGYKVQVFKTLVFSFAGMIAGLAGALYSYHEGFIGPGSMGIVLSTYAVLYGLFGGSGTLIGPILGVAAIETIAFTLSDQDAVKSYWPVILGADPVDRGRLQADRPARLRCHPARADRKLRVCQQGGAAPRWRQGDPGCVRRAAVALLEAHAVGKVFGALRALDDVDITVRANTFHGLIGPNGSGKSTLLKAIAGDHLRR